MCVIGDNGLLLAVFVVVGVGISTSQRREISFGSIYIYRLDGELPARPTESILLFMLLLSSLSLSLSLLLLVLLLYVSSSYQDLWPRIVLISWLLTSKDIVWLFFSSSDCALDRKNWRLIETTVACLLLLLQLLLKKTLKNQGPVFGETDLCRRCTKCLMMKLIEHYT